MQGEPSELIAIDELVLRVPGLSRDQAPELAERLGRAVQARLRGSGRAGVIPRIELRLQVPGGLSVAELAERIADELVEVLR